jgi:hypothetical protein
MRKLVWYLLAMALIPALNGCGASDAGPDGKGTDSGPKHTAAAPAPDPGPPLTELLSRPRAELAALGESWAEKVRNQHIMVRQGQLPFTLLPDVRLPLAVPVWRQARYSANAGVSLPPYHPEGAHDSGLALHLARHGDAAAARKLADPADADTLAAVDRLRLERNYPAEWTRLAGLMLYHAQVRLATGAPEAVADLGRLHQEIRAALGEKAQASPLGAALLSSGREVLRQAATAWRKAGEADLARDAEATVARWGAVPVLVPALAPGSPRAEAARLFGEAGKGRAIAAASPLRALDVLGLPLPDGDAEDVVALFNGADQLAEVLIVYRTDVAKECIRPAQLAFFLHEREPGAEVLGVLPQQRYRFFGCDCDVIFAPHNRTAGALVRINGGKAVTPPALPRDLGSVHLNRSFEQNRVRFAPGQSAAPLRVRGSAALAKLTLPVPSSALAEAVLDREPGADVAARLLVQFAPTDGRRSLAKVALPLWQAFGPAYLTAGKSPGDGFLALVWEDGRTRYALRLADEAEAPSLAVADQAEQAALSQRAERARAWDREERRGRLAAGKPLTRLPRELERIGLGQSRAEVLEALPAGSSVVRRELPTGVLAIFPEAPAGMRRLPRELFVGFDRNGRCAEVHVRYTDVSPERPGGARQLLEELKARVGAPRLAALPANTPSVSARCEWEDDLTFLRCDVDGAGVDVTLRDRGPGADQEARPVSYLARGPEGAVLGTSRDNLLQKWGVSRPPAAGQPVVYAPPSGPYDAVLAWLDKGRVVRVVVRHRDPDGKGLDAMRAGKAVADAWGSAVALLGWPRRQEPAPGGAVRAWANYDDVTSVRVYWQQNLGEAPRVYTEWKQR